MTAIVIGGGNVGYEVATRLLACEDVVVVDKRYPSWLREIATAGRLRFVERDAVTLSDLDAVLQEVVPGRDPAEDKLICTVGAYSRASPVDDPRGFEREFDLNFFGNVVPIKALLPRMLRQGAGRIVVLSSTSGHHAPASLTAYAPSKWALEGFCGSLHAETRGTGIAVDAISPTTLQNVRSDVFTFTAGIPPAAVGAAVERALRGTGRHRRFVPPYYRGVRLLERLAPSLLDRAFRDTSRGAASADAASRGRPSSALITGASSGLGRELALRYAPEVRRLHLVARTRDALERVACELRAHAPRCEVDVAVLDMSDLDAVSRYASALPSIDLLINNAGFHIEAPIVDTPLELYHRILAANFFGAVRLTSALLARQHTPYRIVNVCSTTAIAGRRDLSAYASTKAALWCFTRSLRRVFPRSLHVLEVVPATFVSSLFEKGLRPGRSDDAVPSPVAHALHGRVMSAADVATCIHRAEGRGARYLFLPALEAKAFLALEVLAPPLFRRLFH